MVRVTGGLRRKERVQKEKVVEVDPVYRESDSNLYIARCKKAKGEKERAREGEG